VTNVVPLSRHTVRATFLQLAVYIHNIILTNYEFSEQFQIPVSLYFFASHRGFSICGTHFAVVKQKLRRDCRCKLIQNLEEIYEVFTQLSNTTVAILSEMRNLGIMSGLFNFYQGEASRKSHVYTLILVKHPSVPKTLILKNRLILR
jgi:hypothetical protein